MRTILLTALLLATGGAAAQDAGAAPSAVVRTERDVWSSADFVSDQFEYVFMVDSTNTLPRLLHNVRQRAYRAGSGAARVNLLLDVVAALRADRGDAIPRCADEVALRHALDILVGVGGDLIALDPTRFEAESFSVAASKAEMMETLAPIRALAAAHASTPEDVCTDAPDESLPPVP